MGLPAAGPYSRIEPACGRPQWLKQSQKLKKKQVVQIQIVVLNILYQYLVVLNVKIRNRFLGTLPALGTVRRSWKDEFNRVKTSHCSAPSNSPPEYKPVAPLLPTAHPNTSQLLRSCQLLNWPPEYKPIAPLLPTDHTNTSQSLRSCQLPTQIQASRSAPANSPPKFTVLRIFAEFSLKTPIFET